MQAADRLVNEFQSSSSMDAAQIARIRAAEIYSACAKGTNIPANLVEKTESLLNAAAAKAEEAGRKNDLLDIYDVWIELAYLKGDTVVAERHRKTIEEIRATFFPDISEKECLFAEYDRLLEEAKRKFIA